MSTTIKCFELSAGAKKFQLEIPKKSQILKIDFIEGRHDICMFVSCDLEHNRIKRSFETYSNGDEIEEPNGLWYLGSYKSFNGVFNQDYHVFERL